MRQALLCRRGLLTSAVVLVLVGVFLRLGWWQWDRANSPTGGFQNVIYAIQWPMFAGFGVYLWWKTLRADARAARAAAQTAGAAADDRPTAAPPTAPATEVAEEDNDPELAEYNRYLAQLNERVRVR